LPAGSAVEGSPNLTPDYLAGFPPRDPSRVRCVYLFRHPGRQRRRGYPMRRAMKTEPCRAPNVRGSARLGDSQPYRKVHSPARSAAAARPEGLVGHALPYTPHALHLGGRPTDLVARRSTSFDSTTRGDAYSIALGGSATQSIRTRSSASTSG
jgi:hypothetical protein